MFHPYSYDSENASDNLYAGSSISGTSVPFVDCPIPRTLPTAHLHRSLKSSRDTSPFPIPGQPSPPSRFSPSPYASSTPSLSRPESRPKSLESGHVLCRGQSSGPSSPSEKGSQHHHSQFPDALNPLHVRDPEKGLVEYAGSPFRDSELYRRTYISTSEMDSGNSCAKRNAVWILIYLSLLSPLLTLLIAIYTVLATLLLLLLAPLSLCTSYASLSVKLHTFLSPPLNFQLHLICSPTNVPDPTMSNTPMLIPLNLLSPIVAAGIALNAWVAAAFWFYAAILGDPEGGDGPDDGRAAVLGVSRWWERWLERGRTTVLEGS